MKLKIKPSARINRRHLLIEARNRTEIEEAILEYVGALGWAKAAPVFVEGEWLGKIVLSIDRKEVDNVRGAFEMSNRRIKVIRVSGTLKGLAR